MMRPHALSLGKKVVDKFTKLCKIGFSMECFQADFLEFFTKNVKFWLLGGQPYTHHQTQVFQEFS